MPPAPLETKYHPSAVDLLLIKRLIAETSKQNLLQFLQHEFVNVGKSYAERLIGKMYNKLLSLSTVDGTFFSRSLIHEKQCLCCKKEEYV